MIVTDEVQNIISATSEGLYVAIRHKTPLGKYYSYFIMCSKLPSCESMSEFTRVVDTKGGITVSLAVDHFEFL